MDIQILVFPCLHSVMCVTDHAKYGGAQVTMIGCGEYCSAIMKLDWLDYLSQLWII